MVSAFKIIKSSLFGNEYFHAFKNVICSVETDIHEHMLFSHPINWNKSEHMKLDCLLALFVAESKITIIELPLLENFADNRLGGGFGLNCVRIVIFVGNVEYSLALNPVTDNDSTYSQLYWDEVDDNKKLEVVWMEDCKKIVLDGEKLILCVENSVDDDDGDTVCEQPMKVMMGVTEIVWDGIVSKE